MNATCCHCQPEHFILWQIREKELNYYSQNCLAVGTQAALLAGFAYSGLTQVAIPLDSEYVLKLLYLLMTTTAMCLELIAVMNTTLLSMMGPGLALRGPDGSMHPAVDGMMEEYQSAYLNFVLGLIFFHFSAALFGWLMFNCESRPERVTARSCDRPLMPDRRAPQGSCRPLSRAACWARCTCSCGTRNVHICERLRPNRC